MLFNVSFFKSQSQVISDYLTLSKSHAPPVLKILNGFHQHINQEQLRLRKVLRTNKMNQEDTNQGKDSS